MHGMKNFLVIFFVLGLVYAQKPLFTEYVTGTAQSKDAQVMFYLQNVSKCVLAEVQVRASHNNIYNSTDSATFVTNLQPEKQETFVMMMSQVISDGWGWTVDAITLAEPEGENDCNESGLIEFDKVVFEGSEQPTGVSSPNETGFLTYTVVAGDTWWGIAGLYNTTPEVIAALNSRSVDTLVVGEVIKVPAPSTVAVPEPLQDTLAASPYPLHTIQAGDTLYGLARTYNTDVKLILQANCLTPDSVLKVGMQLQVPPIGTELNNICQ
jgi:LysM repeat protein